MVKHLCNSIGKKIKPINLTKAEMVEKLFTDVGINQREAREIVAAFFDVISIALENNQQVKLSGFGNFDVRDKKPRPGRNPKTGEAFQINARRVVTFTSGKKLRTRVEGYIGSESE